MANGRILPGFRLGADGAVTARPPGTKTKFRRKMSWKHSAIWDTPAVVTGRRRRAFGMLYDSPSPLHKTRPSAPSHEMPRRFPPAFFCCTMSANGTTGPLNMAIWNLIYREPPRSEEHTSELQSLRHLVCRLLLEKKT